MRPKSVKWGWRGSARQPTWGRDIAVGDGEAAVGAALGASAHEVGGGSVCVYPAARQTGSGSSPRSLIWTPRRRAPTWAATAVTEGEGGMVAEVATTAEVAVTSGAPPPY
jgi:hypothetical protein